MNVVTLGGAPIEIGTPLLGKSITDGLTNEPVYDVTRDGAEGMEELMDGVRIIYIGLHNGDLLVQVVSNEIAKLQPFGFDVVELALRSRPDLQAWKTKSAEIVATIPCACISHPELAAGSREFNALPKEEQKTIPLMIIRIRS